MAEKTDESPASEEGGKKKSGKKKLIIVVVLLLLLGGGAGAFLVLGKKEDPKENKEEHLEEEHPQLVLAPLEPAFIVNLADSGSYLKATIYLEFDIEKAKKMELDLAAAAGHGSGGSGGGDKGPPKIEGILKVKEPLIRDVVIRVLSSKTVDEARSTSQRDALKGELVEAINDVVGDGDGPVTNVIFTEYIVQ
jgi:flagellar FliL protein